MLLLTTTSDDIRVVMGGTGTLDVHASYVDNNSGAFTPGRTNSEIAVAGMSSIVSSPSSGIQRNVRSIFMRNTHGSNTSTALVQHFDGTTAVDLMNVTLLPGEVLNLSNEGEWNHYDANGALYVPSCPPDFTFALGIAGTIAETIPRMLCSEANLSALASGTLYLVAIFLRAGQKVSAISFYSATTAANTPTNQFFALYNQNRVKVAESDNNLTAAWAANTIKTLNMVTPYVATYTGLYYVGIMITATTVPTMKGSAAKSASQLSGVAPTLHGSSNTGLTTSVPATANAITATTSALWARVA